MNLLLRPLNDVNDVTWSIVISLIILLVMVGWVIKYILGIDAMEAEQHGSDDHPQVVSLSYNFRVISIDKVLDGDTIDVTIDLGFDLYKKRELELLVWTRQRRELETLKKRS